MISQTLPLLLATAALSLLFCRLLAPVAVRVGLLDRPSERKVHSEEVPLVGGIGIFIAFAAVLLITDASGQAGGLLAACALLLIVGLVDDWRQLSALTRFGAQITACCLMIFHSGVYLTDFGSLMWDGLLSLGWLSVPITIFSALGVINAFNMMDGIDGLSSTVFIVAAAAMAWLAYLAGAHGNVGVLLIAIATVSGFFLLNARITRNRRVRVFLGDSGSGFLGVLLAWQFIDLGNGADRAFAPMTAVWIFGIPLADTLCVMVRRKRLGLSMVAADQMHLHHAFLKAGFSVGQTWLAMTGLVMATAGVGLLGHFMGWPEYLMFYAYIACGLVYCRTMNQSWRNRRFLGRDFVE